MGTFSAMLRPILGTERRTDLRRVHLRGPIKLVARTLPNRYQLPPLSEPKNRAFEKDPMNPGSSLFLSQSPKQRILLQNPSAPWFASGSLRFFARPPPRGSLRDVECLIFPDDSYTLL